MSDAPVTAPQDEMLRDLILAELMDRYEGQYVTKSKIEEVVTELTGLKPPDVTVEFRDGVAYVTLLD